MRGQINAALALLALPVAAQAQIDPTMMLIDQSGASPADGSGWIALPDSDELRHFLYDITITILLTASIVHHPVRRRTRRGLGDLMMPRLFFLYALIGMAVGFLVLQHGSVIGFVVFGIGALLRFRSNLDDPVDTVELILVTVLGLAVGLSLPVMAFLIAAASWVFIWMAGRRTGVEISLKAAEEHQTLAASEAIEKMAADRGWTLIRKHHVPGKTRVELLYVAAAGLTDTQIETSVAECVGAGVDVKLNL